MSDPRACLERGGLRVEVVVRDERLRCYVRVERDVFLSNCVRLPLQDFRDVLEAMQDALQQLEQGPSDAPMPAPPFARLTEIHPFPT